jgi:hypothetical protein
MRRSFESKKHPANWVHCRMRHSSPAGRWAHHEFGNGETHCLVGQALGGGAWRRERAGPELSWAQARTRPCAELRSPATSSSDPDPGLSVLHPARVPCANLVMIRVRECEERRPQPDLGAVPALLPLPASQKHIVKRTAFVSPMLLGATNPGSREYHCAQTLVPGTRSAGSAMGECAKALMSIE